MAAHKPSCVSRVSWWPDSWTVHADNKWLRPAPTPPVAEDARPPDANSPNNHYATALPRGFNKLANWLAPIRSQCSHLCLVSLSAWGKWSGACGGGGRAERGSVLSNRRNSHIHKHVLIESHFLWISCWGLMMIFFFFLPVRHNVFPVCCL